MIYWNKFVLNLAEYTPKLTDDIAKKKQDVNVVSVLQLIFDINTVYVPHSVGK
jgi:hypothetical protein